MDLEPQSPSDRVRLCSLAIEDAAPHPAQQPVTVISTPLQVVDVKSLVGFARSVRAASLRQARPSSNL